MTNYDSVPITNLQGYCDTARDTILLADQNNIDVYYRCISGFNFGYGL